MRGESIRTTTGTTTGVAGEIADARPLAGDAEAAGGDAALPIDQASVGLVVHSLTVDAEDIVFVKGIVEASDGLAVVFAPPRRPRRGGAPGAAAPPAPPPPPAPPAGPPPPPPRGPRGPPPPRAAGAAGARRGPRRPRGPTRSCSRPRAAASPISPSWWPTSAPSSRRPKPACTHAGERRVMEVKESRRPRTRGSIGRARVG